MTQKMSSTPETRPEGRQSGRERRCVASGESLPEARLIRFALGPGAIVTPDVAAKLPGRGVWVEATRARVEEARRKNGFQRGFKSAALAAEDLAAQSEALLARRCLEILGLMRRAAVVAIGQAQVESAIRAGSCWALVEASDGAEDGREKLARLCFGLHGKAPSVAACFSAAELGMALGRDRVVHACLLQERSARAWAAEIGRLAGFRPIVPRSWPDSRRSLGLGLDSVDAENSASGAAPETRGFVEPCLDHE